MKQKDWVLIIVVSFFAAVVSLILSNLLISPASTRTADVEIVGPISSEFTTPDKRFFNKDSFNPTKPIRIGETENEKPFAEGQN